MRPLQFVDKTEPIEREHAVVLETIMFKLYTNDMRPLLVCGQALRHKLRLIQHLENALYSNYVMPQKLAVSIESAARINGSTLCSLFGYHSDNSYIASSARMWLGNMKVLILYDVSQLLPQQLTNIEGTLRYVKQSERPFGGVLVVAFGESNMHHSDMRCSASNVFDQFDLLHTCVESPSLKRVLLDTDTDNGLVKKQKIL